MKKLKKQSFKNHFIEAIETYIENDNEERFRLTTTPKISMYWLLGYLRSSLNDKDYEKLQKIIDKAYYD